MPLLKRRTSKDAEIPTSSMADIAFLLLIFFLVTTTINVESGIYMQLPPALQDEPPPEINQRNLMKVLVAEDGSVLIDDELTRVSGIRDYVKRFVTNEGSDPNLSDSPDKAVVSFKTERALPYETYIEVLDEINMAYVEIRDEYAMSQFGVDYPSYKSRLGDDDEDLVADKYPKKLSLAEPDPG